jgi:S1-C subfamily serine protease
VRRRSISNLRSRIKSCCGVLLAATGILLSVVLPAAAGTIFEEAYRKASREKIPFGSSATGSGTFISGNTVLTGAHVLVGCRSFVVESPSIGLKSASIAYLDRRSDMAVLLIDGVASRNYLGLAERPTSGSLTIFGYSAYMSGGGGPAAYSARHISTGDPRIVVLETNVPAGFSGGPVLDPNGDLVGILTGRVEQHVVASPIGPVRSAIMKYLSPRRVGQPKGAVVKVSCYR